MSPLSGWTGGTSGSPGSGSGSAVGLSFFTSSGFAGLVAGALPRTTGGTGRVGFLKSSLRSCEASDSDGEGLSAILGRVHSQNLFLGNLPPQSLSSSLLSLSASPPLRLSSLSLSSQRLLWAAMAELLLHHPHTTLRRGQHHGKEETVKGDRGAVKMGTSLEGATCRNSFLWHILREEKRFRQPRTTRHLASFRGPGDPRLRPFRVVQSSSPTPVTRQ